jgi:dihydroorotate dehydrogenase (fumarate)
LYGRLRANLAATSGIHSPEDVIKLLMAGADVTMLCSVLLRNGTNYLPIIEQGLRQWTEELEYESVDQMRGSMSQLRCSDPSAFERAQYMRAVKDFGYIQKAVPPVISKVENWGPE